MHENIPYVTVAYMKARHTLLRLLGNVTSAGWQVTLCDPIWHVSSRSGEADYLRTAIPVYFTLLLLLTVRLIKPVSVFRNDNEFAHFCSNWHSLACHVTSKLWNDPPPTGKSKGKRDDSLNFSTALLLSSIANVFTNYKYRRTETWLWWR